MFLNSSCQCVNNDYELHLKKKRTSSEAVTGSRIPQEKGPEQVFK